ncbi:NAD(P)/FAD-dependent oxidoreductase [Alkalinema sp. FACHB-956]|uniref:NAD(P)/FAD-dependent oxidoreductase n=1 Tax=Alkalinema sp. FACHB-956 TaxID=2692768 RepID=UPI0016837343|nr:NAD(P)/FAD-dependent oxidoreductase [Alkalinema sp. FACHB-956]MBD2326759.1 NAD(P)/FAD-dependent oxidoreductase [Alkalinema sp. FACHB-956]
MSRICILGGGFGGLYTALRLSQLPWVGHSKPEIILVDQRDRFIFMPLLYELLTGELQAWEIAPTYVELLADTGIHFIQASVETIQLPDRRVQLSTGESLTYDRLVLAMGGETPMDLAPGVQDYALPFRTLEDAYQLESRLQRLENSDRDKIRVAIAGAGYSGIELACQLAARLGDRGRIRIVEMADRILRNSPPFNRQVAEKALSDRGVWVDLETTIASITADELTLSYKGQMDTLPVDIVLWTVGTRVAPIIRDLPLPKTDRGQVKISPTLQVVDHPEIFALGDLASGVDADGQFVPATAQAAFQQADYAGWNLWASLTHRPLLPFKYQHLGEMLTLGTDEAALAGLGLQLSGFPAHVARRMIYLFRMPTLEHQLKVGMSWITRPLVELLR